MIFQIVDYIAFTLALALGYVLGTRKVPKPPKPPAPLRPICSCGHNLGSHTEGKGACHAGVQVEKAFENFPFTRMVWMDCACQMYDGPELFLTR